VTRFYWIVLLLSCGTRGTPAPEAPAGGWANVAPAEVQEALQGDGRMYLRVIEGRFDFWVAVAPMAVGPGDHVLMGKGPERRQFLSKDLERRFKVMTFIDQIAVVSLEQSHDAIKLDPPPGGVAIAEVFARRIELEGLEVRVRGRVVKANKGIFGTNWYHLVDGTGEGESRDLTVTSAADVQVGDLVRARGVLTVDKDLGFGYHYPAIIEEAVLAVER
jgi:hypothetical protein